MTEGEGNGNWSKPLDAEDIQHLYSSCIFTLHQFIMVRQTQLNDGVECIDCERIAGKLGLEKPESM